jgi:hypothetical protein
VASGAPGPEAGSPYVGPLLCTRRAGGASLSGALGPSVADLLRSLSSTRLCSMAVLVLLLFRFREGGS